MYVLPYQMENQRNIFLINKARMTSIFCHHLYGLVIVLLQNTLHLSTLFQLFFILSKDFFHHPFYFPSLPFSCYSLRASNYFDFSVHRNQWVYYSPPSKDITHCGHCDLIYVNLHLICLKKCVFKLEFSI